LSDLSGVYVETMLDETGSGGFLSVAYAICIGAVPGQQIVTATSGYDSADKVITVTCPPGLHVHGTAGSLTGALGQAYLDARLPTGPATSVLLNAREDVTGHAGDWKADVYAICAA
jgi:hypothetical protein